MFFVSLLYELSYFTLSSQEKPLFQKIIPLMTPFLKLFSYFCALPTTLYTSQNMGGRMHGPFPHLKLGVFRPQPHRSPPMLSIIHYAHVISLYSFICSCLCCLRHMANVVRPITIRSRDACHNVWVILFCPNVDVDRLSSMVCTPLKSI